MNILQQIEAQAEVFRVALGLRTWDAQRVRAHLAWDARYQQGHDSKSDGPERQSGRTTRDVLLALAACAVTNMHDVKLTASRMVMKESILHCFEDTISKLELNNQHLNIRLHKHDDTIGRPFVTYTDHHEAR